LDLIKAGVPILLILKGTIFGYEIIDVKVVFGSKKVVREHIFFESKKNSKGILRQTNVMKS